ncbi:hypothetical protein C6X95_18710 [Bacillus pumilus]|nr:hypothetical protein C6X95_18710 [Bacillus pumilus]
MDQNKNDDIKQHDGPLNYSIFSIMPDDGTNQTHTYYGQVKISPKFLKTIYILEHFGTFLIYSFDFYSFINKLILQLIVNSFNIRKLNK